FLVACDLQASTRPNDPESRIRIASLVDRAWLLLTSSEIEHRIDGSGPVRATEGDRYDELALSEKPVAVDEEIAARLLADAWRARDPSPEDQRLLRRLKFASVSVDVDEVIADAVRGKRSLADIRLERALRPEIARMLEREAPDTLSLPSVRTARLDY